MNEQPQDPPNDTLYLCVFGALDDQFSDNLQKQLDGLFRENFDEVVFNLSNVTAFKDASMRYFIEFCRKVREKGKNVRVDGCNDYILRLFRRLKLDISVQ
ncbi:MAG: STAS domain-containing protein [Calditrichae bacterium]|nr:STAS domain-containing protein [Calditrichia bacterium]